MTPTSTPTAAPTILAIDLGRYKSIACLYDPATRTAAFRTLDTGRADFDRPFARNLSRPNAPEGPAASARSLVCPCVTPQCHRRTA